MLLAPARKKQANEGAKEDSAYKRGLSGGSGSSSGFLGPGLSLGCLLYQVSLLRDVPTVVHARWAEAFTEAQDDLITTLNGGKRARSSVPLSGTYASLVPDTPPER